MTDWQNYKRVIFGIEGFYLNDEELDFFTQHKPLGFIIFKRNIENLTQLKELIISLKVLSGSDEIPILIDQEGGRVARLRPPLFEAYPPVKTFGDLAQKNLQAALKATFINYYSIGLGLKQLGINVNCAPVADLAIPGAHSIIGDRSFGDNPEIVIKLSKACEQGLKAAGVQAIIKHMPGHGRAKFDSHEHLPTIDEKPEILEQTDFKIFQALKNVNWAMTAHIIYESLDADNPATQSGIVLKYIREKIGFGNIIISDDLSMKALSGNYNFRAEKSLNAGCDLVLHCNGNMKEMKEVIEGVSFIDQEISDKLDLYLEQLKSPIDEEFQSFLRE